jgi:RNA 2',3'-cyclic 3'-phosphodiesterase
MQRTVRTFVAVEISSEIRGKAQKLIAALAAGSANVKWVEPASLHVTLKFLGNVEMLEVPHLCQAVAEAVADLPPFDVQFCGAGAFPNLERPRTVWIGMREGTEEMIALHDAIEHRLAEMGFRSDGRRFRPHLTIGRVRSSSPDEIRELASLLSAQQDFVGGSGDVSEVVVFSSEPSRGGPIYEPLSHAELSGR